MSRRFLRPVALAVTVSALVLVGCGSDDDTSDTAVAAVETTAAATEGAADAAGPVSITGAWARTSPMSAENGAAYMTITAPGGDRLIRASVDASVAATVELHETVAAAEDAMPDGTGAEGAMPEGTVAEGMGAMTMRPVDAIEVPADGSVSLKPGGLHVMLLGLASPLATGSTVSMTLTFEKAGDVVIDVPVQDEAPTS